MKLIEQLEAALAEDFSRENLQVYADALEAAGDPRGQLIAIDLHVAQHGSNRELAYRRRQRLRDWLGLSHAIDPTRGEWTNVKFAFGFVDDMRAPLAKRVLQSPAGRFVRGISLTGSVSLISEVLHEIGAAPRPWLERLTIAVHSRFPSARPVWDGTHKLIDHTALPSLIAATPRLRLLELAGQHLITELAHPQLQCLRVAGVDAFLPILQPAAALPALRELELAFAAEPGGLVLMNRPWPALLPAESFPALTRLDLSADWSATTDTQIGALDVLETAGVRGQLEELRLWGVQNDHEVDQLRRAQLARLRRLELEHLPKQPLELPGVAIERVAAHWPRDPGPIDSVWATVPGHEAMQLPLGRLILQYQHARSRLAPVAYQQWQEIWQLIEALPYGSAGEQVSSTTLCAALEALDYLDHSHRDLSPWYGLMQRVQRLRNPGMVLLTGQEP